MTYTKLKIPRVLASQLVKIAKCMPLNEITLNSKVHMNTIY